MIESENILITGAPGCGKTTLVRHLADKLTGHRLMGFYTQEIRPAGTRQGFEAISFDGARMILAHTNIGGSFRVGKYGVDIDGFDRFLLQIELAGTASKLIVIDEIGKMECFSERFRQLVIRTLESDCIVIATIAEKGTRFIEDVKKRPNTSLIHLTRCNHDRVENNILRHLGL